MEEQKIIVVDDDDNEIGLMTREKVDKENLRYRVSALWILNTSNECLLAKRASTKTHSPGMWGPAVAGTVEEGETYEDNIIKEAEEELGLGNLALKIGPKEKIDGKHKYFVQWYSCVVDKPIAGFRIQEEEVDEVKWYSEEEFRSKLTNNPEDFISTMPRLLDMFYSE